MKIGKHKIKDSLITAYIKHFGKDKLSLGNWEEERCKLHNAIFESVGLDRVSEEGQEFSAALDEHCIPFIEKKDYFVAGLKKLGIAKNEGEIAQAKLDLQNRQMYEEIQKRKLNQQQELEEKTYTGKCRICEKDISSGGGRVNDHLMTEGLDAKPVHDPICMDCVDKNPDEHFTEFRAKYWRH